MDVRLTKDDNPSLGEDSQHSRGRIGGISQTATLSKFGQLQIFIGENLRKHHVLKLAQWYSFVNSELDKIGNSERPSATFVELLTEKGYISESDPNVTDFLQVLTNNDLSGIAESIKRHIQKVLRLVPEETNAICSKSEVTEFDSDHTYLASAPEESGNNINLTETPKRKPDFLENPQHGKKVKQIKPIAPGKSEGEKRVIYIHLLIDNYRELCSEDKATLIGVASEITAKRSLTEPKYLYMIKRKGGMNLKERTLFSLKDTFATEEENCILIGPHTTPSIVSAAKFKGVNLQEYDDKIPHFKPSLNERKYISIPSFNVYTVKYVLQPKHPVLSVKGVIKDISERGYGDNLTPRRVITLIDSNDHEFLSVVLHEKDFPISKQKFEKNTIVELRYFETARTEPSKSKSNFLTSKPSSVIKKTNDNAFAHLVEFKFVRGRGNSIEGLVTTVGEAVTYHACPDDQCRLKEVNVTEGGYYCSTCKNTNDRPKEAHYIKLTIDCDDSEEYEGIIFTQKINELKMELNLSDLSTEDYLELLPQKLLDRKVKAICKATTVEGMNNIFNTLEFIDKKT